ncbi:MAG: D-TA family PLP-dependent enzyme [Chthoniobacter sp.]|uniref:D-TA family PLP-dependent enzyme n=1 Tax=Chthoniobacter sp. TaxID=2510640 RepID=UPI0032A9F13E
MDWFRLTNEGEVASPALLLFEERIESNLRRMIEIAGGPERLRPHVKTHKLGPLVARQVALGIQKFKCATVAEAEMCAEAKAPDVLLAMPPVGPNMQRLCELAKRYPGTHFSTLVDDAGATRALGATAVGAGLTLDVFLDLDCGQNRTGIVPGDAALELYRRATTTPGLHVAGLHAYDGHIHEGDLAKRRALYEAAFAPVIAFRQQLESAGLAVPVLVAGGTPTFPFHAQQKDRECSPGTTVLWDFGYGDRHVDLPFLPAALLLTRVVSKPGSNRLCLDLGHKAVAAENPHPRVRFIELPDAPAVSQSEEHLVIETPRAAEFSVGDTLHGIPRHVCPTVALYSEATLVRDRTAVERWPILARARRLTI